uniref:G-protein coupled receptors family 1 profile domain-containing protein n=1 Tax=Romanomermis culicivorax TaxID=13658 RepID=A0A915HGT0_ROMCU
MLDKSCLSRNLNVDVNRWKILLAVVFGSIVFLSVLGNALVIAAVLFCRKLRKKENSYYASLAMADLLLCCLVMIFAAANDLNEHWSFGGYCKFWMSFDIMCTTSSIGHMCAVAFDRYNHVRNPLVYNQRSSRTKVCLAILSVWVLSFLIAFVPLAFPSGHLQNALKLEQSFLSGQNNQRQNFAASLGGKNFEDQIFDRHQQKQWQKSSTMNNTIRSSSNVILEPITECFICRLNLSPVYAVVSSSISFFIPCSVMIFVYIKMYRIARRHVTKMQIQMVNNRSRRHSLQCFFGKKTSPIVSLKK